jgi:hypothetical protein
MCWFVLLEVPMCLAIFVARLISALRAWASRHINIRYRVESHFKRKESDSKGCWLQAHDCGEQRKRRYSGPFYKFAQRGSHNTPYESVLTLPMNSAPLSTPSVPLLLQNADSKMPRRRIRITYPYYPVLVFMASCEATKPPDQAMCRNTPIIKSNEGGYWG